MLHIPLTIVDLIVLGILMISGMIAAYRGFLKEALSVSSWLFAALAAVFFWPVTKPFARSLIEPHLLADILALVGVFFLVLIPASFMSFRLSEMVRGSRAGPLDRSLGFVFGIARGLLVVGLGYVIFSSLAGPKEQPEWVREARLLPVVKGTADVIRSLGNGKKKNKEEPADEEAAPKETKQAASTSSVVPVPKPKPTRETVTGNSNEGGGDKSTTYSAGQRRALDALVKSTSKE